MVTIPHWGNDSGYRIFRYPLDIADYQELKIPYPAKIISVAPSRDHPNTQIDMWAVAGSDYTKTVAVAIVGTGNPIPNYVDVHSLTSFIGTVVAPNRLVWHVYETSPRKPTAAEAFAADDSLRSLS